jgi:hypothetical protein
MEMMRRGMSEDAVKRRTRPAETAEPAESTLDEGVGLLSVDGIELTQVHVLVVHQLSLKKFLSTR